MQVEEKEDIPGDVNQGIVCNTSNDGDILILVLQEIKKIVKKKKLSFFELEFLFIVLLFGGFSFFFFLLLYKPIFFKTTGHGVV